jgi:hypothetical protein
MIKKITAIIAAAACAGVIVTLVPGFAPEVAAGATQAIEPSAPRSVTVSRPAEEAVPSAEDIRNAVEQNIRNGSRTPKIVCAQSWPYYEHSCLRDSRKAEGNTRTVRVIAAATHTHR